MKNKLKVIILYLKDFFVDTLYIEIFKKAIKPVLEVFFIFVKAHFLYIFWGIVNFYISFKFLGGDASSFWISVLLYTVSISIALSPLGESILRLINHVRPLQTAREKEYLIPIFEEVYEEVQKAYPNLQKIEICIIDSLTINAYALGLHTVAVTKGAVEAFTEDELKGILLHEIAHIINGDTKVTLISLIGNGIFSIYVILIKLVVLLLDIILSPFQKKSGGLTDIFIFFIRLLLSFALFCFTITGNIILSANSRQHEYSADEFASKMGYGSELISALYLLQKLSLGETMKFIQRMQEHHPHIAKRIGRLEALEALEMSE